MILGVDHIALSCDDLAAGCAVLEAAGWGIRFREDALPNHPAKRPFLRQYHTRHGVAYARGARGLAVELTAHGTPLARPVGGYHVSGIGAPPAWADLPATWTAPTGPDVMLAVEHVALGVPDLATARAFWCDGLGARLVAESASAVQVRFAAPVPSLEGDLHLALDPDAPVAPALDDAGFPCLALLCSDVAADAERALRAGATRRSGRFDLTVAGRPLRIELLAGPSGELVELIQLART